jgi:asparagine synthetase B (glutamine-hydrolysing)
MSGFVAIIAHRRSTLVAEDEMTALADVYETLRGPAARHSAQAGQHARLIAFDTPSAIHPGILRDGASWAAADGLVHAPSGLIRTPLDQLDGMFALVRYDAQADELIVAADPLGMRPVYSAAGADRTYVSNSALALAVFLNARPNELGMFTFLRVGMSVGPTTSWQGVERLNPGSCLRFSDAGCQREVYWHPVVDESIRRLTPFGPLWSDLTGGHDSRLLDLLLERAGVEFHANTTGDPQHIDVRVAREVAAAAGWDWHNYSLPGDWPQHMQRVMPSTLGWSDSNLDIIRLCQVLWTHQEKSQRWRLLLGGGGHEHWSGRQWLHAPLTVGKSTPIDLDQLIHVAILKGLPSPYSRSFPGLRLALRQRDQRRQI